MVTHEVRFDELNQKALSWKQDTLTKLAGVKQIKAKGKVTQVLGTLLEAQIPAAKIGDLCKIFTSRDETDFIFGEVVGFSDNTTLISALNPPEGISYGSPIEPLGCRHQLRLTDNMAGKVYDGMGRILGSQEEGIFSTLEDKSGLSKPVICDAVPATEKPRISDPLETKIKSIDTMLTIGKGQRLGLFAGAGCGKTTLLASLARGSSADTIVFALIGERGRELKEFLDHELDDELKKRTILVCATSDRSSMERSRAALTATAIAEGLRDQGQDVLLLVDSLTRFARAQREIGLAAGEPPAKGGFPPSVYTMLPRLIERAGKTYKGSITAIYTILMEGDSMSDPIADEAKSLLDGHIVLSRKLAEKGHYPAVDILMSLSRTMTNVVEEQQMKSANRVRGILSAHKDLELLIKLGEYTPGNDPESDDAVTRNGPLMKFFQQGTREQYTLEESLAQMNQLAFD